MTFATFTTGVHAFECAVSSPRPSLVHGLRLLVFCCDSFSNPSRHSSSWIGRRRFGTNSWSVSKNSILSKLHAILITLVDRGEQLLCWEQQFKSFCSVRRRPCTSDRARHDLSQGWAKKRLTRQLPIPMNQTDDTEERNWILQAHTNCCLLRAMVTWRFERRLMLDGDVYRTPSIIGSGFVCRIARSTTVGGRSAIIRAVSRRAWITGVSQYMLDPAEHGPPATGSRTLGRA